MDRIIRRLENNVKENPALIWKKASFHLNSSSRPRNIRNGKVGRPRILPEELGKRVRELSKQDRKPYTKRKKIECVPASRFSARLKKIEHETKEAVYKLYELEDVDENEDDKIIDNINQVFKSNSGGKNTTIEATVSSSSGTLCDEVGIASSNKEKNDPEIGSHQDDTSQPVSVHITEFIKSQPELFRQIYQRVAQNPAIWSTIFQESTAGQFQNLLIEELSLSSDSIVAGDDEIVQVYIYN